MNYHADITDIPVSRFASHVKKLHMEADKGFSIEFSSLQKQKCTFPNTASQLPSNKKKNRYPNILPCEYLTELSFCLLELFASGGHDLKPKVIIATK